MNLSECTLYMIYANIPQLKGRVLRVATPRSGVGDAILTASEENKVDMIIIGGRPEDLHVGKPKTVKNSTSVYVMHNSRMPSIIVRGEKQIDADD